MMKFEKPICFFDLETTGTDVTKDRIVELAIIKIQDGQPEIEKQIFLNPEMPIPESASLIHGITDEKVKDSPTFKSISKGLHDFIKGSDIGGYNSNSFDIPLLFNEFKRAGIEWDLTGVRFIDVCNIFKRKEERTLSAAVRFYCDYEHEGAHGALADVQATIDVFNKQYHKYELPDDMNELALFCNYDKERFDLSGHFSKDADGDFILNFGKHKGTKAHKVKDYLQWMVKSDFASDTKDICNKILSA